MKVYNGTTLVSNTTISFLGFPWDTKQFSGVCLIRGGYQFPNCVFPNYKYVIWITFLLAFIGLIMWRAFKRGGIYNVILIK